MLKAPSTFSKKNLPLKVTFLPFKHTFHRFMNLWDSETEIWDVTIKFQGLRTVLSCLLSQNTIFQLNLLTKLLSVVGNSEPNVLWIIKEIFLFLFLFFIIQFSNFVILQISLYPTITYASNQWHLWIRFICKIRVSVHLNSNASRRAYNWVVDLRLIIRNNNHRL